LSETDCTEILRELETYADHELEAGRAEEIKHHLDLCSPCMDRAEFRSRLREIVARKCCSEEVPDPVVERIRAILSQEPD
jgi:mycothiol system anti-sigma-R factor